MQEQHTRDKASIRPQFSTIPGVMRARLARRYAFWITGAPLQQLPDLISQATTHWGTGLTHNLVPALLLKTALGLGFGFIILALL
jgi:hypothetical protein